MRTRPSQLFFERKAAAALPAVCRVATTATMMLAGEWTSQVFFDDPGQRNAQQCRQVPTHQNAGDNTPGLKHSIELRAGGSLAHSSSQCDQFDDRNAQSQADHASNHPKFPTLPTPCRRVS